MLLHARPLLAALSPVLESSSGNCALPSRSKAQASPEEERQFALPSSTQLVFTINSRPALIETKTYFHKSDFVILQDRRTDQSAQMDGPTDRSTDHPVL